MQQVVRAPTTVTKEFRIEAAHFLVDHPGKCRYLHGHSYVFKFSFTSLDVSDDGILIDYAELKAIAERTVGIWDHCVLTPYTPETIDWLFHGDESDTDAVITARPIILRALGVVDPTRVVALGMPTTAENLAFIACRKFRDEMRELKFESGTVTVSVAETCTSDASVTLFIV